MRKGMMALALCALCLPMLAGCDGLDGLVTREIDTSVLYVGGYPTTQDVMDGTVYSHFLYVDFLSRGQEHVEGAYDVEVNLDSGILDTSFSDDRDDLGNLPGFYDIGPDIVRGTAYADCGEFFEDGGRVAIFTSVGHYDGDRVCASLPAEISRSGCVVAVSTIRREGESLRLTFGNVYRDTLGGLL